LTQRGWILGWDGLVGEERLWRRLSGLDGCGKLNLVTWIEWVFVGKPGGGGLVMVVSLVRLLMETENEGRMMGWDG
jgi:hypothetical protein